MKKFKMELVWHNCEECPPEEDYNSHLILSDGIKVCEVRWDKEEGFSYFSKKFGYRPLIGNYKKMWWADVRQTAQNDLRFRGLIVDDLVKDLKPLKI